MATYRGERILYRGMARQDSATAGVGPRQGYLPPPATPKHNNAAV